MIRPKIVELKAYEITYFSQYDEEAFFEWLTKIVCVESYVGRGNILFIKVNYDVLDEDGLRDLVALFYRYNLDMHQLKLFDHERFSEWFRDPKKYWFNEVFG
ncbi:hypothetical protein ACFQNF_13205 [Iodobacter arcticus]|uniref:Uncharacterized protein n=1 Tax=Iodobacter arcticus TaxID=590593 RepID=A0ABW2QZ63_9NEIS